MAVARLEMSPDEVEAVLRVVRPRRSESLELTRAAKELARALERGREAEKREREHMAKVRRNRRAISMDDTPLTPQSMSRLERSRDGAS